jgi:outer membrane cobalamin receptor
MFYSGYEPRLSARYNINDRHSIKFGYARMTQYLHLVASSSLALPTDLWYPVTKNVKPGASDQWSVGWFTYFGKKDAIQVSVELYSKKLDNLIEYREGARLLLNDNYEAELVRGTGAASGIELMLQKNNGRWNGWIGYTLSWATRVFPDLNGGQMFYARYDRRHDFSIVANYDFTKRLGLSFAWVYSSGSPFTPIVSKYVMPYPNYAGVDLLAVYPLRNSYRLHASHRLDIDFVIKGRKRKRWQGEWHLGAYNFYNRTQPNRVSIVVDEKTGKEKYQERGLFGVIASLSYNFKF